MYLKQKTIMETALRVSRRPRLAVRELLLLPFAEESPLKVRCVIVNVGDAIGTIVESHFEVQAVSNRCLMPLQPFEGRNPLGLVTLAAGENRLWEAGSTIGREQFEGIARWLQVSTTPGLDVTYLYFRGFLTYEDGNRIKRRTAFYRCYNVQSNRFDRMNDPDYEYSD